MRQRARAQGDVHKKKEVVQDVTLHDLDAANAKPQARPAARPAAARRRGVMRPECVAGGRAPHGFSRLGL